MTEAEPEIISVSDKGQVAIPAYLRNRPGLKPRSKLIVYGVPDAIVLKKLKLPDMKKEMHSLWKEVDGKIAKYGEMTEDEISGVSYCNVSTHVLTRSELPAKR